MKKDDVKDFDARTLREILLDEECSDPITMFDDEGNAVEFAQLAVIPDGETFYAVMTPVAEEESEEDEGVYIFKLIVDPEDGEESLVIEDDEEKAQEVFDAYMSLLEEAGYCDGDCDCCDEDCDCCDDDCDCHNDGDDD